MSNYYKVMYLFYLFIGICIYLFIYLFVNLLIINYVIYFNLVMYLVSLCYDIDWLSDAMKSEQDKMASPIDLPSLPLE